MIVVSLLSCKATSVAQEADKPEELNKSKIQRPAFGDPRDNEITKMPVQLAPNTVGFLGAIKELKKNNTICSKNYKVSAIIRVGKITSTGSGIVNALSTDQEFEMGFIGVIPKNLESLKSATEVSFMARENLCSDDMGTKLYEIFSFKILD